MKKSKFPRSSREAFAILDKMMSAKDIKKLLATQNSGDLHFGLGLWIRNNWIYPNKEEIIKAFRLYNEEDGIRNALLYIPDHLSDIILKRYLNHVKRKYK